MFGEERDCECTVMFGEERDCECTVMFGEEISKTIPLLAVI
jgi:hypothetical protein